MITLIKCDNFRKVEAPVYLATGFFDGVHLGHRHVLAAAMAQARAAGGTAWALTFDQHPLSILAPQRQPPMLTSIGQRLDLLEKVGLDGCLMLPFSARLAALAPAEFLALITAGPGAPLRGICCGANWRFGQQAAGSPEWLRAQGFEVLIAEDALYEGAPVSSTRIREAIRGGDLPAATAMLGRPYAIREVVRHGRGLAHKLGMATANFHPAAEVLPPIGVYAVRSAIRDRVVDGVASYGYRPTFADACPAQPVLEAHFFDFDGDLYGAVLEIAFIAYIREERRFASTAQLVGQVQDDIARARALLATQP